MEEGKQIRVAINGFGRIGRLVFRRALETPGIKVVAINDLVDTETLLYYLRYDSVHGNYGCHIERIESGNYFCVPASGRRLFRVKVLNKRNPEELPWCGYGVDVVVDASGVFTERVQLQKHLYAGARIVILTAPSKTSEDVDITMVLGVNEDMYDPQKHHLISNASCTTNCLAPLVKVLHQNFGIEEGLMITTHAYTADQRLVDAPHKDLCRGMAAALNIVPTKTGAAKAIGLVLPELAGKLDGLALRVPVPDGSIVSLNARFREKVTKETINEIMKAAAEKPQRFEIFYYSPDPLVSSAIVGNSYSTIFDPYLTKLVGNKMAHVAAWYDNEWGYSCRVVDLINYICERE